MRATIATHLQKGDAISLWQHPHTRKTTLIAATKAISISNTSRITTLPPGFIAAPFDRKRDHQFLKAEKIYHFANNDLQTAHTAGEPTLPFHTLPIAPTLPEEKKEHYIASVCNSIDHIEKGLFEKVVLSQRKVLPHKEHIDPFNLFQQLCVRYPHAFVSLISTPTMGTWVGASPELLLHIDDKANLSTAAVAGTKHITSNNVAEIQWGTKEKQEQALVSQYIHTCFEKAGIHAVNKRGPTTYRAGNVVHLKTDFEAKTPHGAPPHLGAKMLHMLHPTPAVCGSPQQEAEAFIKTHEPFDRQFYGGYLGPVNINDESHIYANLRCMQWGKSTMALYAGAGITRDSIPKKEWEETTHKMNTLLHILGHQAARLPHAVHE